MTSRKPDFNRVYTCANEFLAVNNCIEGFPFSLKALIKEQSDVQVCSFGKAMDKYGIPIKSFGSESALLEEYCGAHIIFFNEKEEKYRMRFSLGHEFGHFVLNHKMNLDKDDPLYGIQEVEANCFSAQLLMPEQILRECTKRGYSTNNDYIKDSFGVSKLAAEKRHDTIAKNNNEWNSRSDIMYDDIILERYLPFIDRIAPKRYIEKFNSFYFDDEFVKQQERECWLDNRSRW